MRPRIRHRLPGIRLTVGENLGKNPNSGCTPWRYGSGRLNLRQVEERKESVVRIRAGQHLQETNSRGMWYAGIETLADCKQAIFVSSTPDSFPSQETEMVQYVPWFIETRSVSPSKSIRSAARELNLPRSTVHKVLYKNPRLYAYKVELVQELFSQIIVHAAQLDDDMLARIDFKEGFLQGQMHLAHIQCPPHLFFAAHCPFAAAHSQSL
ncbi:hypothetical protein ANN_05262 [Periplaneta americana]|uniref:Uncharacterized protein n=1 Tax=Periplaneta americana TaxID=6978 RepID=A0ABQ8TBH9_PERAM|nr:hypothetical protein ANN_05262 [Periplaneta americana]